MRNAAFFLIAWLFAGSCLAAETPARILLSFDDGPSTRQKKNPTEIILDVLAQNTVQNGIKVIFFTRTRLGPDKKGELTRTLLQREHDEGHVLAVHDGTLSGLRTHRSLKGTKLDTFLAESRDQLQPFIGHKPELVRPPLWAFDQRTLDAYQANDLHMLLTDVSVGDGKSWGYRANPRRRSHLLKEMKEVEERIDAGEIPVVDGLIPIIVTFHDTNTWTAKHMNEYLEILVESANKAGIRLDTQAYYADGAEVRKAAMERSLQEDDPKSLVPAPWSWIWR